MVGLGIRVFLRGKEKVSGEQLWLGSLQSCGISKTLSSPLKEASSGFAEKAERLQKAITIPWPYVLPPLQL